MSENNMTNQRSNDAVWPQTIIDKLRMENAALKEVNKKIKEKMVDNINDWARVSIKNTALKEELEGMRVDRAGMPYPVTIGQCFGEPRILTMSDGSRWTAAGVTDKARRSHGEILLEKERIENERLKKGIQEVMIAVDEFRATAYRIWWDSKKKGL